MNYQRIHDNIIMNAWTRPNPMEKEKGYERHHIKPTCMGGSWDENNIVKLTYKEHFVIHHLLYKIYRTSDLWYALHGMAHDKKRGKITAHMYQWLKDNRPPKLSFTDEHRANLSKAAKNRIYTDEHRAKMRAGAKKRPPVSDETRKKMSEAGKNSPPVSDETKANQSRAGRNRPRGTCEWCGIETDTTNLTRYHNDKCKYIKIATG